MIGYETVREIDASLRYLDKLRPSSTLVFKVAKKGAVYVLKTAFYENDWEINHLKREMEVLQLAKGIQGITHLIQIYGDTEEYKNTILKEFFEGESIASSGKRISDVALQKELETTVRNLHSLGIARLDIGKKNLVVSPDDKKARIIDLGNALFRRHFSHFEFEKMKFRDLNDLEIFIFE